MMNKKQEKEMVKKQMTKKEKRKRDNEQRFLVPFNTGTRVHKNKRYPSRQDRKKELRKIIERGE